ncbi:hypothetical protein ABW21_db0208730 [Orbilia brochopaga]|nr:hypothetical protein ABW21_db0208730 [Drechslerella brochopaga]
MPILRKLYRRAGGQDKGKGKATDVGGGITGGQSTNVGGDDDSNQKGRKLWHDAHGVGSMIFGLLQSSTHVPASDSFDDYVPWPAEDFDFDQYTDDLLVEYLERNEQNPEQLETFAHRLEVSNARDWKKGSLSYRPVQIKTRTVESILSSYVSPEDGHLVLAYDKSWPLGNNVLEKWMFLSWILGSDHQLDDSQRADHVKYDPHPRGTFSNGKLLKVISILNIDDDDTQALLSYIASRADIMFARHDSPGREALAKIGTGYLFQHKSEGDMAAMSEFDRAAQPERNANFLALYGAPILHGIRGMLENFPKGLESAVVKSIGFARFSNREKDLIMIELWRPDLNEKTDVTLDGVAICF